jgi:threonine dehydrogenase-like Zn-dependent dehydrogenase
MRALVLDQGKVTLADRPSPARPGECLIRVIAAGICGTDLELLRGYAGFSGVPGHEFVGVVEDAPAADRAWIGRRVAGEITVGCEECPSCRAAGRGHCDVRTVLGIVGRDGAFAEFLSLPATNLHAVPDAIDDVTAVFVEPLAAACRILEQVKVEPGMRAAVVGAGRLGLLVAQVLRNAGATVTVVVRSDRGRAAAGRIGFDVLPSSGAPGASRRFDLAADVTGDAGGFALAAGLVRPRGTVVVKSTFHGETTVAFAPVVVDEISIVGSRCGPFREAIRLLEAGSIDVEPWPRETYGLDRYDDGFRRASDGVKVILRP